MKIVEKIRERKKTPKPPTRDQILDTNRHLQTNNKPIAKLGNSNNQFWDKPPPYSSKSGPTPTRTDDNDKFAFLSRFDTIFIIDDSSSMSGPRWRDTKDAIEPIVDICTKYDEDGIDIHFINKLESFENVTSSAVVREIFSTTEPRGITMLATRMHAILDPYVLRCERGEKPKPINLIVITDGKADDPVDEACEDVAKRLDTIRAAPWQVGIQFFQVGNDAKATRYLEELDDELPKNNPGMRDIVDTQPYRAKTGSVINSDGILKTVLGAVNRKQDRKKGDALHF